MVQRFFTIYVLICTTLLNVPVFMAGRWRIPKNGGARTVSAHDCPTIARLGPEQLPFKHDFPAKVTRKLGGLRRQSLHLYHLYDPWPYFCSCLETAPSLSSE